jgi:predicted TIM-barrel enzyme
MTPLEIQLTKECDKLIAAIRSLQEEAGEVAIEVANAAASEVEDFIVNNCGENNDKKTQRSSAGSPHTEVSTANCVRQAQKGIEERLPQDGPLSLEETARYILVQIDDFAKRSAENGSTDTGEVWELLEDWQMLLSRHVKGRV